MFAGELAGHVRMDNG